MLYYYFTIAIRNLFKNKLISVIKLGGLTASVTAFLLIGLYLEHESSFDDFHQNADRIVRVTMEYRFEGEVREAGVTGNKVVPAFVNDFPEVENGVRINLFNNVVRKGDKMFEEPAFYYADSTFFNIFTFPLLAGNPKNALNSPDQVVLTQSMAQKYFGAQDPLGKTLKIGDRYEYVITGVMADPPANSQLQPDFVASLLGLRDMKPERSSWWNANYGAYLLLKNPEDYKSLQAKIPGYMRQFAEEHNASGDDYLTYNLEPLKQVHLHSNVEHKFVANGDIRYIYLLIAIGLFILVIGSTIYINLETAVSTERAKEVGVQKILGASRKQLFFQHLGEAGLLTSLAIVFGYVLAVPLLGPFNNLLNKKLDWQPLFEYQSLLAILGFGIVVSLLAGIYPALVLSKFQPAKVIKGKFKFSSSGVWLRKGLIVLQYSISTVLIIGTLVLLQQMHFIRNVNLGFEKDRVLALSTDQKVVENIDAFKSEFARNPDIRSASLVYESPVHIQGGYGIDRNPTGGNWDPVQALPVDQDFIKTMNINLVAGQDFNRADVELVRMQQQGKDSTSLMPIMINETQAHLFDWPPEEAVGKLVHFQGGTCTIKAVMKDFHFNSLHHAIGNLVVFPSTWGQALLVKLEGRDIPGTLQYLEQKWAALAPHRPFEYHFIDEEFDALYQSEIQTSKLVSTFAMLAIIMACMGLFGLATYNIIQRTKEIGVRKVLGASVGEIVRLLAREFIALVLVALVISIPMSWFLMDKWLQDFAYRITLEWWVFALAGIGAVAVSCLAISYQSIRSALANPVNALRSE